MTYLHDSICIYIIIYIYIIPYLVYIYLLRCATKSACAIPTKNFCPEADPRSNPLHFVKVSSFRQHSQLFRSPLVGIDGDASAGGHHPSYRHTILVREHEEFLAACQVVPGHPLVTTTQLGVAAIELCKGLLKNRPAQLTSGSC